MTVDQRPAASVDRAGAVLERSPRDRMQVMLPVTGDLIIWQGHRNDTSVLYLEGDLDAAGTVYLDATIGQLRATRLEHITVDSTGLRFIDVHGYRALIGCLVPPDGTDEATLVVGPALGRLQHLLALAGCGFDCAVCNLSV